MRNVILHYHIFKNAGSSIERLLSTGLGDRSGSVDGPNPWSILTADQVRRHLLERPELVALTSHHARPPVPAHPDWRVFPIVILRHPIDRVASIHRFEKDQDEPTPGSRMARKSSFADYVRWRLGETGEPVSPVIRDFQTLNLSSAQLEVEDPRTARASRRHLDSAKEFLESLPAFGLVEEFDESIARLRRWLRPSFPELELVPVRANVSQEPGSTLPGRVREMRSRLGDPLYQAILDANRLDLELYQFAEVLFRSTWRRASSVEPQGTAAG